MDKLYKYSNYFIWLCLAVYVLSFFSVFFTINNKEKNYELIYQRLMQETLDFNSSVDNDSFQTTETPLFFDARQVVDYAYNKVVNSDSYELNIIGKANMIASKAGIINVPIDLKVNQVEIKYASGHHLLEIKRIEDGNKNGQTIATTRYYKNREHYKKDSKDLSYDSSTGIITAHYTEDYKKDYDNSFATYVINKDTIKKELYFKTIYNVYTGKIEGYSASVELNTTNAVKDLCKRLAFECGFTSLPVYTNLVVHCIIAPDGSLISANLIESYKTTKADHGGISLDFNGNYTIQVVSCNKEPSILEPKF